MNERALQGILTGIILLMVLVTATIVWPAWELIVVYALLLFGFAIFAHGVFEWAYERKPPMAVAGKTMLGLLMALLAGLDLGNVAFPALQATVVAGMLVATAILVKGERQVA